MHQEGGQAQKRRNQCLGFSLIELSIVLSIIGLLIAVITLSKYLKEVSKVTKTITQIYNVEAAVNNFQLLYDSLPGDISNADEYFGNDCYGATSGSVTCNGNGDNLMGSIYADNDEVKLAWTHLRKSKIYHLTDSLTALTNLTDFPKPELNDAAYFAFSNRGIGSDEPAMFNKKNKIMIVTPSSAASCISNACADNNAVSADHAMMIDDKIDDALPLQGRVIAYGKIRWQSGSSHDHGTPGCYDNNSFVEVTVSTDTVNTKYNEDESIQKERNCALYYKIQ
jgi:prepilin-type N-terminal cleavage/methylation domain-containing protein